LSIVRRYDADQIEAGDTIAIKEGKIRRFYHVCEVLIKGSTVQIVYRDKTGFVRLNMDADDPVRIRE
jgi:hypothetical protein